DACRLERRCRQHPPLASDWTDPSPWAMPPSRSFVEDEVEAGDQATEDAAQLDSIRRAAAAPLMSFVDECSGDSVPVRSWIMALARLAQCWQQSNPGDDAPETDALLRQLGELLGDARDALGSEILSPEESFDHLTSLLS